jgi:hypothetical protein
MKKVVISVALALGLGTIQARAQEEQATEVEAKQGVVGRVFDDLKESTRTVREINRENLAAEKEMFRAKHAEAIEPDAGFEKFRQAKGLKNKMQVVAANIGESCRENSEKEKLRREEIRSHNSYRNLLNEQREKREATIKGCQG